MTAWRQLFLGLTGTLVLGATIAVADDVTYRNDRFGTEARFPAEAFPVAQPEPVNGDGRAWTAPNGAELFIYARANRGGETPRSIIADRAADDTVTYKKAGKRWVVVSGYRDGKIFYERYIFRGDLVHSVAIRYPEAARNRYDKLVGPITNSLRARASSS
ncbi:hypothetical protein Sa4125_28470 [Aureimonas sp. SA4125]|uniref:hypothetical protein n=1 Tax=Aureimonas sp. SA4125 TaxID=2826993 RepID=UPI001CC5F882|nr:hypothetical protein [Aureimonas sp. SA4125]BDA85305.1 hypothetical protein Sa4125_28470 [Aureimonas sp. SA4125]